MATTDDHDPETLIARCRGGDRSALGTLLEIHRNYVNLLVRLQLGEGVKGKLDVEDVVQEVFLEAHRGFEGFRGSGGGEWLAWLRRVVAGVLANQLRRFLGTRRRDVRMERSLGDALERSSCAFDRALVDPQSSPSQKASRREQAVLLADALAAIPEDYREVIILRQLEDLPFPEVAGRMGRSVDSVKNIWVRALARLRRELETKR